MTEERKELIKFRLEKAQKTLEEAVYQTTGNMWNLSVNRLYYSCYYSVIALLLCIELFPKSHKGTHNLFHKHFIATKKLSSELANLFSTLYDARQECDYKDFVQFERSDVLPLIEQTKEFLENISNFIMDNFLNN